MLIRSCTLQVRELRKIVGNDIAIAIAGNKVDLVSALQGRVLKLVGMIPPAARAALGGKKEDAPDEMV